MLLPDFHYIPPITPGEVLAWGSNEFGQLGNGPAREPGCPAPVQGLRYPVAIAAGGEFSLALLRNHRVVAWGENSQGQLGDAITANSDAPVPVKGLRHVTAIASGGQFSLALLRDGRVKAWGANDYGQLGDGTTVDSSVPVTVTGLRHVAAVAAGSDFALVLLRDGTVVARASARRRAIAPTHTLGWDRPPSLFPGAWLSPCRRRQSVRRCAAPPRATGTRRRVRQRGRLA